MKLYTEALRQELNLDQCKHEQHPEPLHNTTVTFLIWK